MPGILSALRASIVALVLILLSAPAPADETRPTEGSADNTVKPVLTQSEIQELLDDIHPRNEKSSVLIVECGGAYGYETIQSAIDAAADGDVIVVLPNTCNTEGRYYENIDFLGKAITVQSVYPTDPAIVAATIIDGEQLDSVVRFNNDENADSVLDGLTITNGDASAGGGVHCYRGSTPTVIRCDISGNTADFGGGVSAGDGIYIDCTIRNNSANYGAGVSCGFYASPIITGCTLEQNTSVLYGGGLYCNNYSEPTLDDCVLRNNQASSGGGSYFDSWCEPVLSHCSIIGNSASLDGGGVYNRGSPTLTDCAIRDNIAASKGGGIYNPARTMTNCQITGNKASSGGGVHYSSARGGLSNCLVSGNIVTREGGGIHAAYSTPRLTNCTIIANSAPIGAGLNSIGASVPTLTNCILWGNSGQEISYEEPNAPNVTYCAVQGGWAGPGNIDLDPQFAFPYDPHLKSDSPCIDAGCSEPLSNLPDGDLDGNPRTIDGNGDSQAVTDMGVYEFNPAVASIAVSSTRLTFFIAEGQGSPAPQELMIRNAGGGTLQWSLDWDATWLQADVTQGESTGETDGVILTADASTLSHGSYSTQLTISDPSASNALRVVDVSLNVTMTANVPGAYATVQEAIDAATVPGDEVVLADGTYTDTGNKNLDFGGKSIAVRSASGDPALCVIDCEGSGRGFIFQNGETSASVVEGLTIRNGYEELGGGVYCYFSSPTLENLAIETNKAFQDGGGICCDRGSSPVLVNCLFSGNTAFNNGGALWCEYAQPFLTNCIMTNNSAAYAGGGVCCNRFGDPVLTNCTILGNSAIDGGALCCLGLPQPTLSNCILWSNAPEEIAANTAVLNVTYCNVQGGWPGTGNIDLDPSFAFLGDVHLTADSPCIDTGTNTPPIDLPNEDFDGNPRSVDGDGDSHAVADMGAYEFHPTAAAIAVSPPRVVFFVPLDGSASQEFMIRNSGGGTLQWVLDWDAEWLQADVAQGESTGEVDSVMLTVDTSTLLHDSYSTLLTISDPSATNAPRIVEVVLNVNITANVPGTYAKIQEAIDAATVPGDVVELADGTYTDTGNKDLDFGGKAITVRSASGDPSTCVIDCKGSERGFIFQSGETGTSVVEGITIRNGLESEGGGVYCSGASPTFTTCVISGNASTATAIFSGGGGICCDYSSPTLNNCTISGNSAVSSGGGIACTWNSNPTLRNCTISGNSRPYVGGGLFSYESNPTLINCTIAENAVSLEGAGVVCRSSSMRLIDCVISSNIADYSAGGIICWESAGLLMSGCTIRENVAPAGGGFSCAEYTTATLTDCIIIDNHAPLPPDPGCPNRAGGGGAYCWYYVTTSFTNCTFSGNTSDTDGGGMYFEDCHTTLTDCRINGNGAFGHGGGIYSSYGSDPAITNCTLSGNTCSGDGGGLYSYDSDDAPVTNSILWGNQPQEFFLGQFATIVVTHSNIQGGWPGIGNIDVDPLFVDPDGADDVPGTEDDDFRLLSSSPCIDAGDPDFVAEPEQTDLDGMPRVMGCRVDIGAYEFVTGSPGSGDLNGDGEITDVDITLFVEALMSGGYPSDVCVADLNEDGQLDGRDINVYVQQVLMH